MNDRLRNAVDSMKRAAAKEGVRHLKGALPPSMSVLLQNPEEDEEEEEDEEGDVYGYDDEQEGEYGPEDDGEEYDEEDFYSMAFENPNEHAENLAMAVAAWRMLSENDDDIVASHKLTGIAFFGNEEDFQEFCDQKDLNYNSWDKYTDPHKLKQMDCDMAAFKQVMADLEAEDPGLIAAQEAYEKFHWGDKSKTTGFLDIPGLSPEARPYFLGVAREICYGAKKDGDFHEYYHLFGEESGAYPAVYGVGENVIVIYGGNTRISPRGIID